MLDPTIVEEIKRLLNEGRWSQRQIARDLGVSRGTVNAIALGRRPDRSARRGEMGNDFIAPSGPAIRCPSCGGKVQMPCLACGLRTMAAKKHQQRRRDEPAWVPMSRQATEQRETSSPRKAYSG